MQRVHLSTSVGLILCLSGFFLVFSSYPLTGTIFCVLGYFFSIKEVSKYTSWFQFATVFLSAAGIGITLEYPFEEFPFITIAALLAAGGSILRVVLFRLFGYTQHAWFEPLMTVFSSGVFVAGNLINKNGWAEWTFPLLIILFQGLLASGILKDKKQLLNFTKGGYRITIGKEAPDFSLPDQEGTAVELTDFRDDRHLLLIFVRGDWCPGCHMMLRTYQKEHEKFRKKNIMVMAIGPDPVGVNREMVEKLGVDFKVLADEGQKTAMRYGVQLAEYDHDFAEKYEEGIPLPASFLIDKKGIVRYVSRPDRIGEFLNPSKIFPVVDSLT